MEVNINQNRIVAEEPAAYVTLTQCGSPWSNSMLMTPDIVTVKVNCYS